MLDTPSSAQRRYFELLRKQTPAQKLRTVTQLDSGLRRLVLAGIRERHPDATPGEVSEKQWRDVLGVIRHAASALDDEYLDRWAPHLAVADLLRRARQEANT